MAACCLLSAGSIWADINPKPFVVPELKTWTGAEGQTTLSGRIIVKSSKAMAVAEALISDYQEMFGRKLTLAKGTPKAGDIVLTLKTDKSLGQEGYVMNIGSSVELTAATQRGLFWATRTLLQVSEQNKDALPKGKTVDVPEYKLRGFMIDCGRHFFSVDYLKKLIDVFAMHNINYFHWHLTEDQGWRIAINKYPKLTEIGSVRSETTLGHNTGKYDGKPVTGYYTQEDAREIVRYAAERYMTVIPEVDMPGHIQSALAAYPELGCTGGPYDVCRDFGVIREVMCAGKPWTLAFAKDVINEIMDIFPAA